MQSLLTGCVWDIAGRAPLMQVKNDAAQFDTASFETASRSSMPSSIGVSDATTLFPKASQSSCRKGQQPLFEHA